MVAEAANKLERKIGRLPSFLIIGAMKAATSTLYEQLLVQPGIYLPSLKEPNFFSNDDKYALGVEWYSSLFEEARTDDILGEASTHYTKLPTYPHTITRMRRYLERPRLVYIMRDPVDRLISQYIHEWSQSEISQTLEQAVTERQELVGYSCYARQLAPFIETYGKDAILPVFFDRLITDPQKELERVCGFIGYKGKVEWHERLSQRNISAERVRKFPFYNLIVEHPLAVKLRRTLVPKAIRSKVRRSLAIGERPILTERTRKRLEKCFNEDLAILGEWLGTSLNCENFRTIASTKSLEWR